VATEAAGTPAARFLPLPFSILGQFVQPLNKGFIKNCVAVASSNLHVSLNDLTIRQLTPSAPQGGGGGSGGSRVSPPGGQVRGRDGLDDDGACLLRKDVTGFLDDLGARKARIGGFGGEAGVPRSGSPA
jgi:hypothetical protein